MNIIFIIVTKQREPTTGQHSLFFQVHVNYAAYMYIHVHVTLHVSIIINL